MILGIIKQIYQINFLDILDRIAMILLKNLVDDERILLGQSSGGLVQNNVVILIDLLGWFIHSSSPFYSYGIVLNQNWSLVRALFLFLNLHFFLPSNQ